MSQKYQCPECGSKIKVWADIDAQITFAVNRAGKLTKPVVTNNNQSDGRAGVECSECHWTLSRQDMAEDDVFFPLVDSVLDEQSSIEFLTAKRNQSQKDE
jgi:DNA-directed RNA polymerase subunit RPC12/RpoP